MAKRSDFDFKFWGFRVLGFQSLLFWKVENLNPTQGFEHVKGYAGFAAGKPRVCSEHLFAFAEGGKVITDRSLKACQGWKRSSTFKRLAPQCAMVIYIYIFYIQMQWSVNLLGLLGLLALSIEEVGLEGEPQQDTDFLSSKQLEKLLASGKPWKAGLGGWEVVRFAEMLQWPFKNSSK